jgi:hypothetical protein
MITAVADPEADIYALRAAAPERHSHVLTRAWKDRQLVGDGKLVAAARQFPPAGGSRRLNCRRAILASASGT